MTNLAWGYRYIDKKYSVLNFVWTSGEKRNLVLQAKGLLSEYGPNFLLERTKSKSKGVMSFLQK